MDKEALGIDLGDESIKVARMTEAKGGPAIQTFSSILSRILFEHKKRIFGLSSEHTEDLHHCTVRGSFSCLKALLASKDLGPLTLETSLGTNSLTKSKSPGITAKGFNKSPPGPTNYGNQTGFTPIQLIAMLLGYVRRSVEKKCGHLPRGTVLTAPYWYSSRERQMLADCMVIGGFHPIGIITDIVAVALHYGISSFDVPSKNNEKSRVVAFLDIGRSDTSATVVTYSGSGMRVHHIAAEPDFGGHDIDQILFLHFTAHNPKNKAKCDPKTTSLLMNRCEDLKKNLSTAQEGKIDLGPLVGSAAHLVQLTQDEFQSIISNWLHRASNILLTALSTSGFDPTSLDAVELVGGSSQIACLGTYIQNIFRTPVLKVNARNDLSAAQGAAHACTLIGSYRADCNNVLQDPSSTPFDIKWETASGKVADSSWVDLPNDRRLSDLDLVSLLELELSMEETDKLVEEAEKTRHILIDYMAIISENLDRKYADVSDPSTISLLRTTLDNAMQYVASSDPDSTNKVFYEAHLQTLHDIADPLENIIDKRPKISSKQTRVELCDWGTNLVVGFTYSMDDKHLDEGISCLEEALNWPPAFSPEVEEYITYLAMGYSYRFECRGDDADIDKAVSFYQRAYRCSSGTPDASLMSNLGAILVKRFEYLGELADIENAISVLESAVQSTFDGQRGDPQYLTNLGCALIRRFEAYGGDKQELDRAVWLSRTAVDLSTEKGANRIQCLMNLGLVFQARFEKYGDLADINDAVHYCDEAVRRAPETYPSKPLCFHSLGIVLQSLFIHTGDMQDIRRAVSSCEEAVRLANELSPDTPRFLASLGACLSTCYEREGRVDDMERAIKISELAVKRVPDGRPEKYTPLNTLGNALLHRFFDRGERRDINRAIDTFEKAARLTKDHPDRPLCFTSLGNALVLRFEQYGDITDVDKAVRVTEKAVELLADTHPSKPDSLNSLARSLAQRFSRLSEVVDINKAISAGEKCLSLLPKNHARRFKHMMNHGFNLSARFQNNNDPEDARKAIRVLEKAADLLPKGHRDSAMLFNGLGNSLFLRFERSGDPLWLEKAIKVFEKATQLKPDNLNLQADSYVYHRNLGNALIRRFQKFRDIGDINRAVFHLEKSMELIPDDHPNRSWCLYTLAQSLVGRFSASDNACDFEAAILRFSDAATSRCGSTEYRFLAARTWVDIAKMKKHKTLKDAYDCFLDLLPRVAWLGLKLERRREEIAKMGSIACDAAAAAIESGDPQTAVAWLEKGRFIIWSQGLQLRSPIDELRALHPDLAERLENISVELERTVNDQTGVFELPDETIGNISRGQQKLAMRQRMLADEWDQLLATIRKKKGFEKFLSSKSFQELSKAASKYPVAIANPSDSRCDVILILPSGKVQVIPLSITYERLLNLSNRVSILLKQSGRTARGDQNRALGVPLGKAPDKWSELLEILWTSAAYPVIKALNLKPSQSPPRLSWCPTGIFSQLPLHAAGNYKKTGASVHDFVISSYTPTLSLLLRQPNTDMARRKATLLAVGVSRTIIQNMIVSPLPMVNDELTVIRETIPAKSLVVLENDQATVTNILKEVPRCSVLHLACHAYQDLVNPLLSAFLVHGEKLYLSRLIQESLSKGELAFLSACQTARGDENAPDEAIHLAGAILFAGFRSVIATMWSIDDFDGPIVTKAVYSSIYSKSGFEGNSAATALHHIVRMMHANGTPFESWVPFISLGL